MRDGITFGAGEQPEQPARAVRGGPDDRADLDAPIETKLHPPGTRREWQARPTFIQHLADAAARLVLVAAPAGYGKTTLVAQWRSSTAEDRRFAWVSLDRDDNDPGRLWWYVVTALQRTCPELDGESILRELRAQTPEVTETVLPMLANELAALAPRLVLVLDDYHLVRNRTCHDQVAFLLLHLPPSVQMVIITRADPALPLARLRATGGLAEIRARELRFAAAEAAALVESTAAVQLREPDLAELIERTEGWPAGVYLAALSLRGQPSPGDFVHRFSGDNRLIVDFLAEEVFGRQPQHIQRFLARTSVLTRFCAPLCEAVTGEPGAAEVIEVIERENLFVVSLDDNRRWFRYHHLFAQLLRRELSLTEPGMVAVLHERASAWHRRHGSADEAVSHALAAGDPTRATDLIAHLLVPLRRCRPDGNGTPVDALDR